MASFESRRFWRTIALGVGLTLVLCAVDQAGLLSTLDDWFYDIRAKHCQYFTPKPDGRIVHVDIDDASLDFGGVGKWPWSRGTLARIIGEIGRAKPAAILLDIQFSDSTNPQAEETPTTRSTTDADDDAAFSECLAEQKNVILAQTFKLPFVGVRTPEYATAMAELTTNPELTMPDFVREMQRRGIDLAGRDDVQDLFTRSLKLAMHERVYGELQKSPLTDEELKTRLLPHLANGINEWELTLLKLEAAAFRNKEDMKRFGLNLPQMPLPAVTTEFSALPLPFLQRNAMYCGFVNYDYFNSSTVRSVPLMVEAENKLYPQIGLVLGCAVMGVDVHKVRVEADQIVIPKPDGTELKIPTHSFHSGELNRNFSLIADIPWFGGSDWRTIYDWPNYKSQRAHLSANVVWDICKAVDKIRRNNTLIDYYVQTILGRGKDDLNADDFEIDVDYAKKYFASHHDADDGVTREKAANFALASMEGSPLFQGLQSIPVADRAPSEKLQLEGLLQARDSLKTLAEDNAQLMDQLASQRSFLAGRLAGKGVLFGYTAEGYLDVINTSLIIRCPGVVVHGVIAESVLSGHWWKRAPWYVGLLFVLLLGFATSLFVANFHPLWGFLATVLLVTAYLLINGLLFFDWGSWLVPIAGTVVTISVVWSGCTLQRVIFEGIERNRVATEVAIISREMDLAHKVQAALIPKEPPKIDGLEAEGWTLPADKTGGDCYDLWRMPDGRLAILVADASGHGLAPAMIVSQVRTLLRALCELEINPTDLLKRVNARVADDLESGRFITVFLGFLSPDGLLEYASAGHGPQFIYNDADGELLELESTGAPLGFDSEWLCDEPGPPIQIAPGGTLALFSDGIFEAMNPGAELFGIDRLKEILQTHRQQPGRKVIEFIRTAVLEWQQKPVPGDDQTIVVARRIQIPPSA